MSKKQDKEFVKLLDKCDRLIQTKEYLLVEKILEDFPEIKSFTYNDKSLLLSCFPDDLTFMKRLVKLGVNPNLLDSCQSTWLMSFSSLGNYEMVEFLLKNGADVNLKSNLGETAFSHACAADQFECAKLLYKYGADINAVVGGNSTPLDCVPEGSTEFIHWLTKRGGEGGRQKKDAPR